MVKYIKIADDLRQKIKEQKYTYGQKLPYEYVLCMNYDCNKETMKKALDILVKEGLIVRRRGAGTFVKDYDPAKDSANAKYATELYRGHKIKSEVITFEVIPSDEKIAKKLQIEEGSLVYHIIRFRKINEKPFNIEIIYMPISVIPSINVEHLQSSIYKYIEKELQLKIQSAHKTIRGHLSTKIEQEYLGLTNKEPYFEVEQIGYLSSGVIFEYSFARFRYDDFELQTIILKQ